MTIKIPVPYGQKTDFITLKDVLRIEKCTLTYFKKSTHNLYIIEKLGRNEEVFSLYTYPQKADMLFAYNTIQQLLQDKTNTSVVLQLEPMQKV